MNVSKIYRLCQLGSLVTPYVGRTGLKQNVESNTSPSGRRIVASSVVKKAETNRVCLKSIFDSSDVEDFLV